MNQGNREEVGQLIFDLSLYEGMKSDVFLVEEGNNEAYSLCSDLSLWASTRLILQGPVRSGRTLLARRAAQRGAEVFEDMDLVLTALHDSRQKQDEFELDIFHRLNWAQENGKQVLLTCTRAPVFWSMKLPDLRSRILAIPCAVIAPPSDTLIIQLLGKHFSDRQLLVASDVIIYLAARIERSYQAVFDVVRLIDCRALKAKRKVSLALVRQVLADCGGS